MAAASVSGSPTALALKQAGLEYLLLDEARALELRNREADHRSASPRVRTGPETPAGGMRDARAARPAPRMTAPRRELAKPDPEDSVPDTASWPAVWRERLTHTRGAPVLWSYWELGRDVCGTPDPQRRALVQALLRDLAHPPGTHSFWPVALPARQSGGEYEEPEANAPIFWEGVRLLRCRALIVMGSQALRALALPDPLPAMRPFQQRRHQGRLLIVLPAPGMLLQDPQHTQTPRLREFLRQALAPFVLDSTA